VFWVQKNLAKKFHVKKPLSIIRIAQELDIPTWEVDTVNDAKFLAILEELKPDLIINQAQEIVKSGFINIPPYGVLNRHSSLLPKNRGRLTPFWLGTSIRPSVPRDWSNILQQVRSSAGSISLLEIFRL